MISLLTLVVLVYISWLLLKLTEIVALGLTAIVKLMRAAQDD